MNTSEFSDKFDVMINAFFNTLEYSKENSRADIKLDEYEKSFFLTKAQDDIVVSLYNGTKTTGITFESKEEVRRYLSPLVSSVSIYNESDEVHDNIKLSAFSRFYKLPDDLMFITYESLVISSNIECLDGSTVEIIPMTQDELARTINNPFRGISNSRAFRLDINNNYVEIISKHNISKYNVRYIRFPKPIILENLDSLTIKNTSDKTECELPESIHNDILELAVNYALSSKNIGRQTSSNNK